MLCVGSLVVVEAEVSICSEFTPEGLPGPEVGQGLPHIVHAQPRRVVLVGQQRTSLHPLLGSLEFTGPPRIIQQGVQVQTNTGAAQFVLTPDGSLAFVPGEAIGNDVALARVERDGFSTYLFNEREHVYVWVLGRWIPVSTSWLSS